MKTYLRTPEMRDKYQIHLDTGVLDRGCIICEREPLECYKYWKVIENHFPYDRIASLHNMLVPMRHVTEEELTKEEYQELQIKKNHTDQYHYIIEAANHSKSIPQHFHLHLIVAK